MSYIVTVIFINFIMVSLWDMSLCTVMLPLISYNHYLVLVGKVSNEAVRVVVLLVVERVKIREV